MANLASFSPVFLLLFLCARSSAGSYNVLSFGAKPGAGDAARAFLKAWSVACSSSGPSTIYVPTGNFFVRQAHFEGPCRSPSIKFSIDGTLVAPSEYTGSSGASSQWIAFSNVDGVSISGGRLDGRGARLWACKSAGRSCPAGASVNRTF